MKPVLPAKVQEKKDDKKGGKKDKKKDFKGFTLQFEK